MIVSEREKAISDVSTKLNTARSELQLSLNAEEVARRNESTKLQDNIDLATDQLDAEEVTRKEVNLSLQKKIDDANDLFDAEAQERKSSGVNFQEQIDGINEQLTLLQTLYENNLQLINDAKSKEDRKIGFVYFSTSVSCPQGYISADGDYVDAGLNPALNLVRTPNLVDNAVIGWDRFGAREVNSFQAGSMQAHSHSVVDSFRSGNAGITYYAAISNGSAVASGSGSGSVTRDTSQSGSGSNTVDNVALNTCIKAQ